MQAPMESMRQSVMYYNSYKLLTMGSHIVRKLKALDLYKLAWRWPQCGRNMLPLICST